MKPPRFLYKYQPIDQYTIDNLKARKLYFRKPVELDDPFDCCHRITKRPRTDKEKYKVRSEIQSKYPEGIPAPYDIDDEHVAEVGNPILNDTLKKHLNTIGVGGMSSSV